MTTKDIKAALTRIALARDKLTVEWAEANNRFNLMQKDLDVKVRDVQGRCRHAKVEINSDPSGDEAPTRTCLTCGLEL